MSNEHYASLLIWNNAKGHNMAKMNNKQQTYFQFGTVEKIN